MGSTGRKYILLPAWAGGAGAAAGMEPNLNQAGRAAEWKVNLHGHARTAADLPET